MNIALIREKVRHALSREEGFSLTELLVTILIMVLASTMLATGIPTAQRVYENIVDSSNAQVLLSTVVSTLRGELDTATDVSASGTNIYYTSDSLGVNMHISVDTDSTTGKTCIFKETIPMPGTSVSYKDVLVSEGIIRNYNFKYGDTNINPALNTITIKDIEVSRTRDGHVLASLDSLDIKLVTEDATSTLS